MQHAFAQGQQAIKMRLWDVAEKHFNNILAISPMDVPALAHLAFVHSSTQQHIQAIDVLRRLLKTGVNEVQTHFNLGAELFKLNLFEPAIQHYQACLKLNPGVIDAYIDSAICHRALRQYEDGIQLLKHALDIDKVNARAFQTLGLIYADLEDFAKALSCLESAIGLAPNVIPYKLSFANVLTKAGLDHLAEKQWYEACELDPNHADSFIGFGEFLIDLHAYDEALECLNHAITLTPKSTRVLDDLGETYMEMSNLEKSLENYDLSLSLEPNRLNSLKGKANALLEHGKIEEVISVAKQLSDSHPTEFEGTVLIARAKKSTPNDGISEQLLHHESNLDSTSENYTKAKAWLNFILGKVFDDRKDYATAFKHYAIGNELRDSLLEHTQINDKEQFDEIINFYNQDFFSNIKNIGSDSDFPILIVGMPRSSTTLTEQIISSHPKVMAAGEVSFWNKAHTSMPLTIGAKTPYPACVLGLTNSEASKIAEIYVSTLKKITGNDNRMSHITDKLPHNFLHIGLITTIFPNARIIHTKRDPVDTCLSIFFQNFSDWHSYGFNLENLGFHYRQYERLMAHWHKVLPGRILDINYEDTIADPEYWTRKLIDYVGLEWDDACLAPHKLERSVKTASIWQVRQPIYKTSVQRWKHYEPYIQPLLDALAKPWAE